MMMRFSNAVGQPQNRAERGLVREIAIVLLVKLTLLALAAVFVFGPHQRPHIDAAKVAAHLFGASPHFATRIAPLPSTQAARKTGP